MDENNFITWKVFLDWRHNRVVGLEHIEESHLLEDAELLAITLLDKKEECNSLLLVEDTGSGKFYVPLENGGMVDIEEEPQLFRTGYWGLLANSRNYILNNILMHNYKEINPSEDYTYNCNGIYYSLSSISKEYVQQQLKTKKDIYSVKYNEELFPCVIEGSFNIYTTDLVQNFFASLIKVHKSGRLLSDVSGIKQSAGILSELCMVGYLSDDLSYEEWQECFPEEFYEELNELDASFFKALVDCYSGSNDEEEHSCDASCMFVYDTGYEHHKFEDANRCCYKLMMLLYRYSSYIPDDVREDICAMARNYRFDPMDVMALYESL